MNWTVCSYIFQELPSFQLVVSKHAGLQKFDELVSVLDSALSGEKYGDYITEGAYPWCHVTIMWFSQLGYSGEVDSLRAKIQVNNERTNQLIAELQKALSVPRLAIASHKSFFRVLEVTKTHTAKVEKHPDLIRRDSSVLMMCVHELCCLDQAGPSLVVRGSANISFWKSVFNLESILLIRLLKFTLHSIFFRVDQLQAKTRFR